MKNSFSIAAIFVLSFAALKANGACGDKISVGGTSIIIPPVITWDANFEEAVQVAAIKKKPFAIYFSSKEDSKIVGESIEAIKDFMKVNDNTFPAYLADVPRAIDQAREIGVGNFVKIPLTKEFRELREKYAAEPNTLVICTPSGEKLAEFKCTTEGLKNLDPVKKEVTAWLAKNPKSVVSGK